MNAVEALNKIKSLLGLEVKLMEYVAEDGTVFYAEAIEEGQPLFIVGEDGNIPAPEGSYELDGKSFMVDASGIIVSVNGGEEVEPEPEQEMEQEQKEPKKIVETSSKETHFEDQQEETVEVIFTDAHKEAIKEIVKELLSEMRAEDQEQEDVNEVEVEAEEVEAEEVEMAEQTKPIKHSPEKQVNEKYIVKYGQNRPKSIQDRVFAKFNNN